jgi:hypothetical protein
MLMGMPDDEPERFPVNPVGPITIVETEDAIAEEERITPIWLDGDQIRHSNPVAADMTASLNDSSLRSNPPAFQPF